LVRMEDGQITLHDWEGTASVGSPGALRATVLVRNPRFYSQVVRSGSLGAAESYLRGDWTAEDLTTLFRILVRNIDVLDSMEKGWAQPGVGLARLAHALRRNTPGGSKRNIRDHYDLGNRFFELFLDDTMSYSCGIFETPSSTMRDASIAKMDLLCRKLDLQPGDHLLEIGTGWGGLAIHAARHYGCRVTTTTISREQHAAAGRRIHQAGLEDRVTLLLEDYRDLRGRFDKVVSVEMIEAVGRDFLDEYFHCCCRLLKSGGRLALQAILVPDHRYRGYCRRVDFIQRSVFPGSHLPSLAAISASVARATDFTMLHLEDITAHYAETLRRWRERFLDRLDEVRGLGYPDRFLRLWEYYLCYCEAGFEERNILDAHLVLGRGRCTAAW